MNIINIEHISKVFGEKQVFDDISCGIHQGDKIGIIGINGTGKTTLLKIIAGLEEPDQGQVIFQKGLRVTYLPQSPKFPEHATVLSYVADGADGADWGRESEAKNALNRLGITDHHEEIDHLSGGERRRLYLLKVLMDAPNVLILDEPTNDLDIPTLTILEDYLDSFLGIVITVSHDRYFLDNIADRIFAFEAGGKLVQYEGGYTDYLEAKERKNGTVVRESEESATKKAVRKYWQKDAPY